MLRGNSEESTCQLQRLLCSRPEGPPGASSNRIVCPSVRLSVRLSVIPSHLQTKCNILSLGDDKLTKLGLEVHLWVPHTSLTSHAPGGRARSKCRTKRICLILTLLPPGASVFHKHMSSFSTIRGFYVLILNQ